MQVVLFQLERRLPQLWPVQTKSRLLSHPQRRSKSTKTVLQTPMTFSLSLKSWQGNPQKLMEIHVPLLMRMDNVPICVQFSKILMRKLTPKPKRSSFSSNLRVSDVSATFSASCLFLYFWSLSNEKIVLEGFNKLPIMVIKYWHCSSSIPEETRLIGQTETIVQETATVVYSPFRIWVLVSCKSVLVIRTRSLRTTVTKYARDVKLSTVCHQVIL